MEFPVDGELEKETKTCLFFVAGFRFLHPWNYPISSPTGQWSEPRISGRMNAFLSLGLSDAETR